MKVKVILYQLPLLAADQSCQSETTDKNFWLFIIAHTSVIAWSNKEGINSNLDQFA